MKRTIKKMQGGLVATIVGARPQFVKAAALSPALAAAGVQEILIHTGQHYDWEMSACFFEGFRLPEPAYNLEVGSGLHGEQTGRMLGRIEAVLLQEKPEMVIVYGDTNSTVAGALAAAKLHIPVAHVEAGLRSFDRRMPEEINRVLTDHVSSLLFAPTETAVKNLEAEGIREGVYNAGDVMYDVLAEQGDAIEAAVPRVLERFGLKRKGFALATVHRAENTDDPERWSRLLSAFQEIGAGGLPVLWPVHPRVAGRLGGAALPGERLVEPLPYVETQALAKAAAVVLTDSGGLQKEAAFHGTPCLVLRDRTEWKELEEEGEVVVVGCDRERILEQVRRALQKKPEPPVRKAVARAAPRIAQRIVHAVGQAIAPQDPPGERRRS